MARWKEPIARLCNAEMNTTGHCYEQRFGSRELVDDAGNLSCNVYLDLNQLRAGMAVALEDCHYSAIHDRLVAWHAQEVEASLEKFGEREPEGYVLERADMERLLADCFLAPIGDQGPYLFAASGTRFPPSGPVEIVFTTSEPPPHLANDEAEIAAEEPEAADPQEPVASESIEPPLPVSDPHLEEVSSQSDSDPSPHASSTGGDRQPTRHIHRRLQSRRRRRASDNVILGMPREQYLLIVRRTAELLTGDGSRAPPDDLADALRQWGVEPERWRAVIEHFGELFHRAVGHADHLLDIVQRAGQRWLHGIRSCQTVFT
jgi:hypothetical protein